MKMSFEFEGTEEVLRCIKGLAEGWTLGEFFSVKKPAKDSSQEPAAGMVFRKAKERKQREKKTPSPPD